MNTNVQLACLPNPNITSYPQSTGISSWAAGWGTLSSGGSLPNNLYNVKLTVYDSSQCSNVFPTLTKNWNSQICSGRFFHKLF